MPTGRSSRSATRSDASAISRPTPATSCARRWRSSAARSRSSVASRTATRAAGTAALDGIDDEVVRLGALVDDLLLLARTDSGTLDLALAPTDLGEIALDASTGLATIAAERDVRVEVDAEPVPMTADADRLRQLVRILGDNAVRHAPTGSTVGISVHVVDRGHADLVVEDRGPGFREADLPHVFERFWRAPDAPDGGTGLGLTIAAWIVERHGGTIVAGNRPGGGARIEVRLPIR